MLSITTWCLGFGIFSPGAWNLEFGIFLPVAWNLEFEIFVLILASCLLVLKDVSIL